jgi:hypothetical protein
MAFIDAFADLRRPRADAGPSSAPPLADRQRGGDAPTPKAASPARSSEWLTWAVAVLLGLIVAVFAGKSFFR